MEKNLIDKRIRANLLRLRLEAGLTQSALAELAGVANVAKIEAGSRTAGKEALQKLAGALNVDVSEFFQNDDWRIGQRADDNLFADLYRDCSPQCRKHIKDLISFILMNERPKKI